MKWLIVIAIAVYCALAALELRKVTTWQARRVGARIDVSAQR